MLWRFYKHLNVTSVTSFPGGSAGKESASNVGDPWVGKISWRREQLLTPVFWPGEFHRLYSPWVSESDLTEQLSLSATCMHTLVFVTCRKHFHLNSRTVTKNLWLWVESSGVWVLGLWLRHSPTIWFFSPLLESWEKPLKFRLWDFTNFTKISLLFHLKSFQVCKKLAKIVYALHLASSNVNTLNRVCKIRKSTLIFY